MAERLRRELRVGGPFRGPEQQAYLSIQRTADFLLAEFERLLAAFEITPTEYNVLRILRGAHGEMVVSEIVARMLTREPHLEEMLAELERLDLARATGAPGQRDAVIAITERGLALVESLDEPVQRLHVKQFQHMPEASIKLLVELLGDVRERKAK